MTTYRVYLTDEVVVEAETPLDAVSYATMLDRHGGTVTQVETLIPQPPVTQTIKQAAWDKDYIAEEGA